MTKFKSLNSIKWPLMSERGNQAFIGQKNGITWLHKRLCVRPGKGMNVSLWVKASFHTLQFLIFAGDHVKFKSSGGLWPGMQLLAPSRNTGKSADDNNVQLINNTTNGFMSIKISTKSSWNNTAASLVPRSFNSRALAPGLTSFQLPLLFNRLCIYRNSSGFCCKQKLICNSLQ